MKLNPQALPERMLAIPEQWKKPCDRKGSLISFSYETWESFTFDQKTKPLKKRAIVYVPYGYDKDRPYPVVYLMHGGWSDETKYFGSPENPDPFKNAIDHAIAAKAMVPMLIVCPTYNNLSNKDSGDYSLALQLTARWPQELLHSLIPAVESHFHTHAKTVDLQGIQDSRNWRAFGGFSMGSVQTWHVFEQCLKEFRYFFPSSGNFTDNAKDLERIVDASGLGPEDFFLFSASGTADFAGQALARQISNMVHKAPETFRFAPSEDAGNVWFVMEPGQGHDLDAARLYIFNAFLWLWK